jgi:hypothetical protein
MKEKIKQEYVRENIKREIKNFVNKILEREDFEEIWQEIIEFCDDLKNKREDYLNCLAYHWLIGSTPQENKQLFLDFEGNDSILKFIAKLKEKYKIN